MRHNPGQLFGEGVKRSKGGEARRYNLFAARLIVEIVKNLLGPRGLEKMFIDILGEVTLTKHGATILRKIDVDHPAAKVLIESSNAVDNEVGDGSISVVVLAGALIEKAEELLQLDIAPHIIANGYLTALELSLDILNSISRPFDNNDIEAMYKIAYTCLQSKSIFYWGVSQDDNHNNNDFDGSTVTYNNNNNNNNTNAKHNSITKLVVDAICTIADFPNKRVDLDDIKIEEKAGNMSSTQLVRGIVIDKTIDSAAMPRSISNAKILLINEDLEGKRTKTDAEIRITLPSHIQSYLNNERRIILSKVENIIRSGANIVVSQNGISPLAQSYFSKSGIISIRRVKENDMQWIEKATGAKITRDLDRIANQYFGYAQQVSEKTVGDERMVFIEGCKDPRSVTILLRTNSKKALDEFHRSVLRALLVLKDFIVMPCVVAGGGSIEAIIADRIRKKANLITGRQQIVIQKFADALEDIPLTIARNAGMNVLDTLTEIRSKQRQQYEHHYKDKIQRWYGIDAIEGKVSDMFSQGILEPSIVKDQVLKTAVEVTNLLVRVDDVLMVKPAMQTHTHGGGVTHSHSGGDKKHDHYFDKLGRKQRPKHHYY
jgi:archaeal chaperonin